MDVYEPLVLTKDRPGDREGFIRAYHDVRATTMALSAPLEVEDQQVQSCAEVSPTKWHLAHTTWFFETFVLAPRLSTFKSYDRMYEYLFNSYYNSIGPMHARPNRGMLTRPTLREVFAYRRAIDEQVLAFVQSAAEPLWADARPVLELGLHHEQQHQELLLTDIKHVLSCNPLLPAAYKAPSQPLNPTDIGPLQFHLGAEGPIEIGQDTAGASDGFCFDHEGPRHLSYLTPHELGDRLITNGEFLSFIESGGYEDHRLWLADGWDVVQRETRTAPIYWHQLDGQWFEFTHYGLEALALNRPVINISYYEAQAFASWTGARLPREAEIESATRGIKQKGRTLPRDINTLTQNLRPAPADNDAAGIKQLVGDAWEWTESAFLPYPGYRAPKNALGEYNGKFMSGQFVLRGGSFATPAGHLRPTYRNFFHPPSRWQFTGLRLARDLC